MGRVSTCQKNCNTIDMRGAQVNDAATPTLRNGRVQLLSGHLDSTVNAR